MDFIKLPKIDLHCHLDGSLPLSLVQELLDDPAIQIGQLQAAPDTASLAEYLEKFDLPVRCLQTEDGLFQSAYRLIEEVSKENIRYLEVRFAPMLSVNDTLSCRTVIESVIRGLAKGYQDFGVFSNVIVCAMRHHSEEQNLMMLKVSRELMGEGVCALDLAGDEAGFANQEFIHLFKEAKRLDMPFTIHSGECGSVENVRLAMELGAKRVGHGIALHKDLELMKEYAKRRIGLEMCPTSNLQTKAVKRMEDYPLLDFLKNDILVSVNTDNRTVSQTTMANELMIIYQSSGQNPEVIKTLLQNAIEMAFASDDIKQQLIKEKPLFI